MYLIDQPQSLLPYYSAMHEQPPPKENWELCDRQFIDQAGFQEPLNGYPAVDIEMPLPFPFQSSDKFVRSAREESHLPCQLLRHLRLPGGQYNGLNSLKIGRASCRERVDIAAS